MRSFADYDYNLPCVWHRVITGTARGGDDVLIDKYTVNVAGAPKMLESMRP